MLPSDLIKQGTRPRSAVINPGSFAAAESDKLNNWREDLHNYERNLEEMSSVNLDQNFKEELQHVDQWFRLLSETERTATIYSLLQHSSPVQIRFFISVLQQLMRRDPLHSFLTPSNPDQDTQSQLTSAVAKTEMEANQRRLTAAGQAIRRPPSTGSDIAAATRRGTATGAAVGGHSLDRHSFALGDTEDYSRLFGPRGNTTTVATSSSGNLLNFNNGIVDDFGRAPIPRTSARSTASSLFDSRSRPRSVIEGDTSLMFPSGSTSAWLNPPSSSHHHQRSSNTATANLLGRMGSAAERPKSADISMWTMPSYDISGNSEKTNTKSSNITNTGASGYRSSWGVPSTVQFSDLSMRQLDSSDTDIGNGWDKRRRAARNSNIPGTVPETDERPRNGQHDIVSSSNNHPASGSTISAAAALDSANRVLSMYGNHNSESPVPSVSASAPFSRRHLAPPGMEKQYPPFLNPTDNACSSLTADHDEYLSDHSETSNISADLKQRCPAKPSVNAGPSANLNGPTRPTKDKRTSEAVNMELLEDVPGWFRTLRLHKYNSIFEPMKWQDIVKLSDEDLEAKGVAALGARRKMLKVFETIRNHCDANNINY